MSPQPAEVVLLGAGASVEAGVPAAVSMSQRIVDGVRERPGQGDVRDAISFIHAGLLFGKGIAAQNPAWGVDVESLIDATTRLADRHHLDVAPFIAAWHPRVVELEQQRIAGHNFDDAARTLVRALQGHGASPNPDRLRLGQALQTVLDGVAQLMPQAGQRDNVFARTRQRMIDLLVTTAWLPDADTVGYLCPMVASPGVIAVATLNYDNTVELAARRAGVAISTGVREGWDHSGLFQDPLPDKPVLKLHGSLDWRLRMSDASTTSVFGDVVGAIPGGRARAENEVGPYDLRPHIIFGGDNKLTARRPFLDLFLAFKQVLERAERLTVIGYSFRDRHINQIVDQWFSSGAARRLRIVDIADPRTSRIRFMRRLLDHADHADRVDIVAEGAGAAIARCYPT